MAWHVIEVIAAVITIIGLPYLVASYRKRAPRFSFAFHGSATRDFHRSGSNFREFTYTGSVRNQSLDPNSIERIYLVVWKTKRKKGTRSFGSYNPRIKENEQEHHLPLKFEPRQGRTLIMTFEVPMQGHDAELMNAVEPLDPSIPGTPPGAQLFLPKYKYELAFEDIVGNFFDQDGILRNRRGIDRRWTLENTFRQLKDGNPTPFVRHIVGIGVGDFIFFFRRNLRRLGI